MKFTIPRKLLEVEKTAIGDSHDSPDAKLLRWSHESESELQSEDGSELECPSTSSLTLLQESTFSLAELETTKLELNLAKGELDFYRKRFWCVPCGRAPGPRCFDLHQLLLQDTSKEKLQTKVHQLHRQNESNKRVLLQHLSGISQLKNQLTATETDIRASVKAFGETLAIVEEIALKLALETEDFGRSPSGITTSELEQLQNDRFFRTVEVFNRSETYKKILDKFQDLNATIKELLVKYPAQLNEVDKEEDCRSDSASQPSLSSRVGPPSPKRAAASSLCFASGFQVVPPPFATGGAFSSSAAAVEEPVRWPARRREPDSSLHFQPFSFATTATTHTSSSQPINYFTYRGITSEGPSRTLSNSLSVFQDTRGTIESSYPAAFTAATVPLNTSPNAFGMSFSARPTWLTSATATPEVATSGITTSDPTGQPSLSVHPASYANEDSALNPGGSIGSRETTENSLTAPATSSGTESVATVASVESVLLFSGSLGTTQSSEVSPAVATTNGTSPVNEQKPSITGGSATEASPVISATHQDSQAITTLHHVLNSSSVFVFGGSGIDTTTTRETTATLDITKMWNAEARSAERRIVRAKRRSGTPDTSPNSVVSVATGPATIETATSPTTSSRLNDAADATIASNTDHENSASTPVVPSISTPQSGAADSTNVEATGSTLATTDTTADVNQCTTTASDPVIPSSPCSIVASDSSATASKTDTGPVTVDKCM